MTTFTFSGPGDSATGGLTTVEADDEPTARHKAMVKRWGQPNGRPAQDTGRDGRYLSHGLILVEQRS